MLAIEYIMDTGEKYRKTRCSFQDGAPYTPSSAKVEVDSQLEKNLYFTVDDGTRLIVAHISAFRIVEA